MGSTSETDDGRPVQAMSSCRKTNCITGSDETGKSALDHRHNIAKLLVVLLFSGSSVQHKNRVIQPAVHL